MTRLVTCGWETSDPNENQQLADSNWSCVTTTPTPISPSVYCLKPTASGTSATKTWTFAAAKTDVYVRVHVFLGAGLATQPGLVQFDDSAGSAQVNLTWTSSDRLLRAYRGSGTTTLIGTASLPMETGVWHLLECRWQASSATSGIIQVWLDGTQVLNLSGVDTTNTANVNCQRVELGYQSSASGFAAFDDLAINDTAGTVNNGQIGDGTVVLLKVTGAGTNAAQTRGGTDSGANWNQVDEMPPSMTDYVFSSVAATRDTYALQDVPAGTWTVNCVEVIAYGLNSDVGAGSLGLTVKSGATTNEGTAQALGITAAYLRQLYETDPNTSAAWTTTAVNALEAGTTVR